MDSIKQVVESTPGHIDIEVFSWSQPDVLCVIRILLANIVKINNLIIRIKVAVEDLGVALVFVDDEIRISIPVHVSTRVDDGPAACKDPLVLRSVCMQRPGCDELPLSDSAVEDYGVDSHVSISG